MLWPLKAETQWGASVSEEREESKSPLGLLSMSEPSGHQNQHPDSGRWNKGDKFHDYVEFLTSRAA